MWRNSEKQKYLRQENSKVSGINRLRKLVTEWNSTSLSQILYELYTPYCKTFSHLFLILEVFLLLFNTLVKLHLFCYLHNARSFCFTLTVWFHTWMHLLVAYYRHMFNCFLLILNLRYHFNHSLHLLSNVYPTSLQEAYHFCLRNSSLTFFYIFPRL